MQHLAPNKTLETTKHRHLVEQYCVGDGLDLGSFSDPINDRAVRIDRNPDYCHIAGDVSDLSRFADNSFDYVHASHVLEDFKNWKPVLDEWARVVRPNGHLIIAVPDHQRFRAAVAAGQGDNFDHKHESFVGEIETFLPDWKVKHSGFVADGDYSILCVLEKPREAVNASPVKAPPKIIRFAHSGDLGDLIYALSTMKAICQRENAKALIVLNAGPGVREFFTVERAYNIGALLGELPWVDKWDYWPTPMTKGDVDYDFQDWRNWYGQFQGGKANLALTQAMAFNIDPAAIDSPWITEVIPNVQYAPMPGGRNAIPRRVVVARSHRYRNRKFPWQELSDRYRDVAICVGTDTELTELINTYGFYAWTKTLNMLYVAQLIAGADLVISNQTSIYALAEAMKKPVILERYEECPNVDFDRPDVWSGERVFEFLKQPDPFQQPQFTDTAAAPPAIRGVKQSA